MTKQVFNETKNAVAVERLEMAVNPWTRFWGLMGKPEYPAEYDGLWIEPCRDIHSLFLRFEFDAVFLDKEGKVLKLEEKMKPWRLISYARGGRAVLEMDGGMIDKCGIEVGDVLKIQESG